MPAAQRIENPGVSDTVDTVRLISDDELKRHRTRTNFLENHCRYVSAPGCADGPIAVAELNPTLLMKDKNSPDQASGVSPLSDRTDEAHQGEPLIGYDLILVPVDFSEHSKRTIEYATRLATLTGARIRLLHVFQVPEYPAAFYHGLYLEHEAVRIHIEAAKREATAQLSLLAEQMHANGLEAEPILRPGNPYEEIVKAAKELGVDLIVIGSHGFTGLGRLLLGSTADRVLQYAPCPVLVVKDPCERRA
jgi:universal stress protein A